MISFRWNACALLASLALAFAGCTSSSSDDPTNDQGGEASVLEGVWWGYDKNVSQDGLSDTASTIGFQMDASGQVTALLEAGAWTDLPAPIPTEALEQGNFYRAEGSSFPEADSDAAWIIFLGSDGAHMGVFELNDVSDVVRLMSFQLDEAALETPPAEPAIDVDFNAYFATWSGTAFDVLVQSPPALNAVGAASLVLFDNEGQIGIDTGSEIFDIDIDAGSTGNLASFVDTEYGFATDGAAFYEKAILPTPDLSAMMYSVCGSTTDYDCGDFDGGAITLDPMSEGDGWGFAWLELQPE